MKKPFAALILSFLAAFCLVGCITTDLGSSMVSVEDQEIANEVYNRLSSDPAINPGMLGITVTDKIVTMTGVVDNQQVKARAIMIARGTPGIGGVIDKVSYQNIRSSAFQ